MLTTLIKQIFSGRGRATIDALLEEARTALAAKDVAATEKAAKAILAVQPRHAEASFYCGFATFQRGNYTEALAAFRDAAADGILGAEHAVLMAKCHCKLQDLVSAEQCCEIALQFEPNCRDAHLLLVAIQLPGSDYTHVISAIHQSLRPATYLEIGVAHGASIVLANGDTSAIGIDPQPDIRGPLSSNIRIIAKTSDAFFAQDDVRAEFGGRPIELAFIDGMHHFDFALRDFAHVEHHCTRNSIILIHDCYPLNRATAARDRSTIFWSGDVWRLILALKKFRPDLQICTIAAHPTGLALVRNLDPQSRVLTDNMDAIVAEFMATDYAVLDQNKQEMLNWFPNDWSKIEGLLKPADGGTHAI